MADKLATALTSLAKSSIDGSSDLFVVHDNSATQLKKVTASEIINSLLSTSDISALSSLANRAAADLSSDSFLVWDNSASAFKTITLKELAGLEVYNVKHYGAVGDGVTNDTTAIQSCFNAVEAAGGDAHIVFPGGVYLHNEIELTSADNVVISGFGATSYNGNDQTNVYAFDIQTCNNVKVFGFKFDRRNSQNSGTGEKAILFGGCTDVEVANCYFHDVWVGIIFQEDTATSLVQCKRCHVHHNTGKAQATMNSANVTNKLVPDVLVYSNTGDAANRNEYIHVSNNVMNNFRTCLMQETDYGQVSDNFNSGSGDTDIYYSNDCSFITVVGNHLHDVGKDGIKLLAGCTDALISGNHIYGCGEINGDTAIRCDASDRLTITNNYIKLSDNTTAQKGIVVTDFDDALIQGNHVNGEENTAANGSGRGVAVIAADEDSNRAAVLGNFVYGVDGICVLVEVDANRTLTDLVIDGNQCHCATASSPVPNGIKVDLNASTAAVDVCRITNNFIQEWNFTGIDVGGSTGTITALTMADNHFQDADATNDEPFYIRNGTYSGDCVIQGNRSDGSSTNMWVFENSANEADFFIKDNYNAGVGDGAVSAISDGTTGGSSSAGAGNQYVELNINGTTYKVLHDGTVT